MYKRTGKLINRKFKEYFIPTVIMAASLSLSLVIDGIMVGNILGTKELAAVNLVVPLTTCVTAVCYLLGVGGSTLISVLMGERNTQKAQTIFTVSLVGLFLLGIIGFFGGLFMVPSLTELLAGETELAGPTSEYLRVFLFGTPFMLLVVGFTYFVRADGMPKLASAVLITANVVNLVMDFIFMYFFKMGISGAAWATITGYIVGLFILIKYVKSPQRTLKFIKISLRDMRLLLEIASSGISSALGQVLVFIKLICLNSLVLSTAGENGVVASSVCISCLSLASLFISGAAQSMIPLAGTFYGEKDAQGVRYTAKQALTVVITACLILTALFEVFPTLVLSLYGVTEPEAIEVGTQAIRIFSLSLVGTGFSFIMMYYTQTVKMKLFSVAICVCQGFITIVPFLFILSRIFGIAGIWSAFAISEIITAAFILIASAVTVKRSNKERNGLFMIQKPDESIPILSVTVENIEESAALLSKQVVDFCEKNNSSRSNLIGVLIEDMIMNAVLFNKKKHKKGYIDIILRIYENESVISFKDDGVPFDPTKYTKEEKEQDIYSISNIEMVQKIATRIEYSRVIGLNCTTVVLARA